MIAKMGDEMPDNRDKSAKFDDIGNHLKNLGSTTYESSNSVYNTGEPNWLFHLAESDLESATDCQENSKYRIPNTRTTTFEECFHITTSSPTQSEGIAITNWDEWDEASDMLSHIDPIIATGKSVKM